MKIRYLIPFLAIPFMAMKCNNTIATDKKVEGESGTVNAAVPQGPTTIIKYEKDEYNFGKVTQGQVVEHTYKFTNIGKEPLIISNCQASCGCTIPEWPRDPIAPGATGEITAKFNTTGKQGEQKKIVTVTANTEPAQTFITIAGMVEAPENAKNDGNGGH